MHSQAAIRGQDHSQEWVTFPPGALIQVEYSPRHHRIENPQLDGDVADIMLDVPIQLWVLNSMMLWRTSDRPARTEV